MRACKYLPWLLLLAMNSAFAETIFYSFADAMASPGVQKILDPSIRLFFGNQTPPALAEKAKPDTHSRSGVSRTPFGGDPGGLCMEAFTDNLESMILDAKRQEYDVIVNIRGTAVNGATSREDGFECNAGRRSSEVQLISEFAVTAATAKLAGEIDRDPTRWTAPKRTAPVSKSSIFLPLEPMLTSPEAQKILGTLKVHWGSHRAPAYSERAGPDDYREEASTKDVSRESACRQAALNVLSSMVEDAREQGYDGIIRIRSYVDSQPAPVDTDFECEVSSKWASVKLLGTLIKTK